MQAGKQALYDEERIIGDTPQLPNELIEQLITAAERSAMQYRPDPERLAAIVHSMGQI